MGALQDAEEGRSDEEEDRGEDEDEDEDQVLMATCDRS